MRTDISFTTNDGLTLRGWHYRPQNTERPAPIIVMVHGFACVKEMLLAQFAEVFSAAGLGVLIFDHRNFGESDGLIRQELDPWRQIDDVRDAITFAATLPQADPEAIGLWGSSYAGGHVFVVAGTDRRVKCAVAQVPFVGGAATIKGTTRADILAHSIEPMLAADRASRMAGAEPGMVPVTVEDPMAPAALATDDCWPAVQRMTVNAPNFRNEVTLRSMELALAYEPVAYVPLIAPTPLLMLVGRQDNLTPVRGQLAAFATALEPKRLAILDGGHFAPYLDQFEEAVAIERDWFIEHLGPKK